MAKSRYTGKDVTVSFSDGTSTISTYWKRFAVEVSSTKAESTSADSEIVTRVTKQRDAKITMTGIDTDDANGLSLKEVLSLQGRDVSAITFMDKEGTPGSKLPANFWTIFGTTNWRVDDVSAEYSEDPTDWSITLTPSNLDAGLTAFTLS